MLSKSFMPLFCIAMLCVLPVASGAAGATMTAEQRATSGDSVQFQPGTPAGTANSSLNSSYNGSINTSEEIFEEIQTNDSSFVVELNISMLTSMFQPNSVLRVATGGTVQDKRVIWIDVGIGRTANGFDFQSEMTMNIPSVAGM